MSIPRRNFLKSATMTTLSAGMALGSAHLIFGQQTRKGTSQSAKQIGQPDPDGTFQVPLQAQQDALFHFRASTFTPYVGDLFQIPNARGEMITLKLLRVSEYKMGKSARLQARQARQPQSFTLTFSATEKLPPFTSIHKVSHPALGKFDLFLTSREADDGTVIYEAVFNHIFRSANTEW